MAAKKTSSKKAPRPTLVPVPQTAQYEVDEDPKRKHHWALNSPGFEDDPSGVPVGKCPNDLTLEQAVQILRRGVGFNPANWRDGHVATIYAVHGGTVYRAKPTNPATPSYHGFPELPDRLPGYRALRERLLELAKEEGDESFRRVEKWLSGTHA